MNKCIFIGEIALFDADSINESSSQDSRSDALNLAASGQLKFLLTAVQNPVEKRQWRQAEQPLAKW